MRAGASWAGATGPRQGGAAAFPTLRWLARGADPEGSELDTKSWLKPSRISDNWKRSKETMGPPETPAGGGKWTLPAQARALMGEDVAPFMLASPSPLRAREQLTTSSSSSWARLPAWGTVGSWLHLFCWRKESAGYWPLARPGSGPARAVRFWDSLELGVTAEAPLPGQFHFRFVGFGSRPARVVRPRGGSWEGSSEHSADEEGLPGV